METLLEPSSNPMKLLSRTRGLTSSSKSPANPNPANATAANSKKKAISSPPPNLTGSSNSSKSNLTKSSTSSNSTLVRRRGSNTTPTPSTTIVTEKQQSRDSSNGTTTPSPSPVVVKKISSLSKSESSSSSSATSINRPKQKTPSPSPNPSPVSRTSPVNKKPVSKPSLLISPSNGRNSNSNGNNIGLKRASSTVSIASSNSSVRSKTSLTGLKRIGSLSGSADSSSVTSRRKKSPVTNARDLRLMMLPQVDLKASDELRLDFRGHRVRNLKALSLSPNLEFVYLRDNLLSSVEGIEILKRVKVLDLSFNDFKELGFEPLGNCKALQQLYLAGNHITTLASLPELPNLEFLSVAQNRLKSLAMASQPRLQVLAASKNKISTLKGFPHLPALEHLRVEENPILEVPHVEAASILLVGPTLKKFNDQDLTPSEVEIAKKYPAHTALCIRDGWEFCSPELASESSFSFLVEQWKDRLPLNYMIKEAYVEQPFEQDACNCRFNFTNLEGNSELSLKYQWFVGGTTPTNFVPIDEARDKVYWSKREEIGKYLKVECTPVLNETEFLPIFAISSPVSPGTGIPKVIDLTVRGDLIEGNLIKGIVKIAWCGAAPGKSVSSWLRQRWNGSPVAIPGIEEQEYKLNLEDINSQLVFMYTPVTEQGVRGEPKYFMTEQFVKAATPSVSNVRIVGDAIEGNTIIGAGDYFGGKEGPTKYEWLREKENGEFLLVSTGTTEYTLTKLDIGRRLKFIYIPVNLEGKDGESAHVLTETVKKAPPKVVNLKIVGDMMEGSKVTAASTITGGTEGSSRVQWFKSPSPKFIDENALEPLTTSKLVKAFRIPLAAVGFHLVAKLTPMAPDGETGDPAYIVSENIVETLPPSLNFLTVTGELLEGELLTASYGYIGGHEGKSQYCWYLHENEGDEGELIQEASGLLQYRITKNAIGKLISFKCTPVRDDSTIGEPKIFLGKDRVQPGNPRLLSLEISGEAIEGTTLVANKKYWGGEEGDSIFRWLSTGSDGTQTEIEGAAADSYSLTCGDIGSLISVSCQPIRNDGAHGSVIISENIGPIVPGPPTCRSLELVGSTIEGGQLSFLANYCGGEKGSCINEWYRVNSDGKKEKLTGQDFLDLSLEDVGGRIELVFTPVRHDGEKGLPVTVVSDFILPAEPKGIELILPDCYEDEEIVLVKKYYGGKEGMGKFMWYRTKDKLTEPDPVSITASLDSHILGETLRYKPSLEDVGSYLSLYWVPTRDDGKTGDPLFATTNVPVLPAPPVVTGVCMKEIRPGAFSGEGKYYGGYEGSSLYSWHRQTYDGTVLEIDGADSITYEVTDSDYTCRLLFGYTPVRSDGVAGELRLSEQSDVILPELPQIEKLSFKGKEMEGDTLTAIEIIPNTEMQQKVWDKYKKEITYHWFYSIGAGEEQQFETLVSAQNSRSYKLRFEDIGRCIKCECTVTDMFGRSTEPTSVVTSPILPGIPKIERLEIEGRGFHTNLYAVRGVYTGGKEGKSRIQWLRSMIGSPDLISIPGEVGRMYEANVDDVGYRLVAVYTPVREDGTEGQPMSVSTEPISVEPDVYKEVKQKLDLGSVKFEVLCDKDRTQKKGQVMGNLEKRILDVNRKRVKVVKPGSKVSFPSTEVWGTYTPPFHVELYRNDQHRFKIVVDSENEVDLMVQTRHMRDIIVLVIRGFAQKFNSTSLNSLLKIES